VLELLHAVDYQLQSGIDEVPDRCPDRFGARGEIVDFHEELESTQVSLRYADGDLLSVWLRGKSPRCRRFLVTPFVPLLPYRRRTVPNINQKYIILRFCIARALESRSARTCSPSKNDLYDIHNRVRAAYVLAQESRLSSDWQERLTVVWKSVRPISVAEISRPPVQIRESGPFIFAGHTGSGMIRHFSAASGFTTSLFLSRMASSFASKDL
jgi:hypothetical protein